MLFFFELLINGAVLGALYSLIALGFVVVYKSSRVVNFALGEFVMLGSTFVAAGLHLLGAGLVVSIPLGIAGMFGVAAGFNRLVLQRIVGRPVISLIMVTIGFGSLIRALSVIVFSDMNRSIPLPLPREPFYIRGVLLSPDELIAGGVAVLSVTAVALFFLKSRTGVALRAIADDQLAAMSMGIDLRRYFTITWGLAGGIAVVGGTLWNGIAGGGFGMVLVGLKVFPIVIIGGLDSIMGVIVGGVLVGLLESLAAGYLDPLVGGGFSNVSSYLVLIAVLMVRPHGFFGREDVERV